MRESSAILTDCRNIAVRTASILGSILAGLVAWPLNAWAQTQLTTGCATFSYTGADQLLDLSSALSSNQVEFKIWGAGGGGDGRVGSGNGGGGGGGYTLATFNVADLQTGNLVVTVGEGGRLQGSGYGGGGAASTNDGRRDLASGGGMSALSLVSLSNPAAVTIADVLAVAGGGGSMGSFNTSQDIAGAGGGWTAGSAPSGGGGGVSNTDGTGTGGSSPLNPGSFLQGGDSIGDAPNGGAGARRGVGAGGGGMYGGGSGYNNGDERGGGGGSGYLSALAVSGSTITGSGRFPPAQNDPDYPAGIGVGGPNITNNSADPGGHGHVQACILGGNLTADLSVTKSDLNSTFEIGVPEGYVVVVTNNGPDDVVGAVLTDSLVATGQSGVMTDLAATCSCVDPTDVCTPPSPTPVGVDGFTASVDLLANCQAIITYTFTPQ